MATDSIAVKENAKAPGEMRISDVEIGPIAIVEDTMLSTYSGTVAVPSEFLITPSKLSLTCNSRLPETPTLKVSSLDVPFSTPINDKHISCTDATCSVCLSPLLCRTALVETRCKVSDCPQSLSMKSAPHAIYSQL